MNLKKKKLNKKQLGAVIAVVILVLAILVPTGIYCVVNQETPMQAVQDILVKDENRLIGKWQGELAVSAYEFREDGSYNSYISTFSFTGSYSVNDNIIKLINASSNSSVCYRYKIKGDTLYLTLVDENGEEPSEREKHIFTRVDHFNLKTPTDAFRDLAEQVNEDKKD